MVMKGEQMKNTTKKALLIQTIDNIISQISDMPEVEQVLKDDKSLTSKAIKKTREMDYQSKQEVLKRLAGRSLSAEEIEEELDDIIDETVETTIEAVIDIYLMLKA